MLPSIRASNQKPYDHQVGALATGLFCRIPPQTFKENTKFLRHFLPITFSSLNNYSCGLYLSIKLWEFKNKNSTTVYHRITDSNFNSNPEKPYNAVVTETDHHKFSIFLMVFDGVFDWCYVFDEVTTSATFHQKKKKINKSLLTNKPGLVWLQKKCTSHCLMIKFS